MDSKTLTIMFTDMKDFTARTRIQSREDNLVLLTRHEEIIRPIVTKFKGRIIKTLGDSFLAAYESPTNAVLSAMEIQAKLSEINKKTVDMDQRIELRIGINAGEVQVSDSDITGDPVNVAARVVAVAEVGSIFFTEAVYLTMNKAEIPHMFYGEKSLKGIDEPLKLYTVAKDAEKSKTPPGDSPFKTQPVSQSGFLSEELKLSDESIESGQLENVFDFTNVKEEKKFDEITASGDAGEKVTVSSDVLEIDSSITEFPSQEQIKPGAPRTAPMGLRSKPPNIKSNPGFELSNEMLQARRKEKSKTKTFVLASIVISMILGLAVIIGFNQYQKVHKQKENEELKKEIEQSPIVQALQKKEPETPQKTESTSSLRPIESIEYGSLIIKTNPSGASLKMDGRVLEQTTPVTLKKIKPNRSYHLVILKKGYKPYDVLLDLAPEETKEIEVNLSR